MRRLVYAGQALLTTLGPMVLLMVVLALFVGMFFGTAFVVAWAFDVQFDSALQVLVYGLMLFGLCSIGWDILRKIRSEYRRLKEADEVQAIDEVLQKQRKDSIL